jgi:Ca2+:H+ antiporter
VLRNGVNRAGRRRVLVWLDPRKQSWETWFLAAVPFAIVSAVFHLPAAVQFLAAALAIIPLAGLMGRSTESIAHRLGPGIGGLLNATFGNAAELILALFALNRGLDGVVKASLAGSVIGNLLLVLGASLLAGGLKYPIQRFNKTLAGSGSTLMVLGSVGLLIPALFHWMVGPNQPGLEHKLSLSVSVVLIITYGLNLVFNLVTHKDVFCPEEPNEPTKDLWGLRHSAAILLVATGFVAWMSEILVGAVEEAGKSLGMNEVFMGVFVVAIVGNAAEHSTAILMALKNQMDLAVGIALGSALQVALFVAPVLVFASYLRPVRGPMDLLFSTFEVVAVILAALAARMVAEDGESNWLEGAMLLMLYAILGLAFYLLPVGI